MVDPSLVPVVNFKIFFFFLKNQKNLKILQRRTGLFYLKAGGKFYISRTVAVEITEGGKGWAGPACD